MSEDKSNGSSLRGKLILIIFGLSGLTALVYEIIWISPLTLVFGTPPYAVSIIIAAFLSGLALGSWIAGRFSDKVENPLKIYGFIEIGIGLYGLMLITLFSALPGIYLGLYQSTFPNKKSESNPPARSPVSPKTQTRAPGEVPRQTSTAPWFRLP